MTTLFAGLLALSLGACSKNSDVTPPHSSAAVPPDRQPLTGNERFGWTQSAATVAGYRFAVYADGVRTGLPEAICQPPVSGNAECTAPLPPLAAGQHTLEVVTWILQDGRVVESAKSPPFTVVIADRKRP